MYLVLILIVVVILFVYGLAPLMVRFSLRQAVPGQMQETRIEEAPIEAHEFFLTAQKEMEACGFEHQVILTIHGMAPYLTTIASFFGRPSDRTSAGAFAVFEDRGEALRPASMYIEFCTEFEDGREVCTNNARDLSPTDFGPDKMVFTFSMILDAGALDEVHRGILENASGAMPPKRALPEPFEIPGRLRRDIQREMEHKTAQGLFYYDEALDAYRPSLRGAYLMTWNLLWPIRAVRARLRDKKSFKLLQSLNFRPPTYH